MIFKETVLFMPLFVVSFVAVDVHVDFRLGQWIAVAAVVVLHMVLSVHVFAGDATAAQGVEPRSTTH